ncbi:uncharacterized protein LOC141604570 isoform X2 [Silene latifolia]|uniref:uncharacterized protein LOC141604570 isoform X2 n=1 Tax=Silene latifolia TaxID=37657 RepID=UPI003D77C0A6
MAQVIRGAAVVTSQWQRLVVVCLKKSTYAGAVTRRYTQSHRQAKGALKLPRQVQVEKKEEDEEEKRRSRNQLKKEAHEAVRWGMELASFSIPQIKRILLAASLEKEKLGPDVREGKRRQFNYIGKLLRDAQPDLLGALIQATKDGDQSRFQSLADSVKLVTNGPEQDLYETESESESESDLQPEDSGDHLTLATRWFDGFIKKDIQISNEVYSVNSVEFDRQELRRLVRNVHYIQDRCKGDDQDPGETAAAAKAAATNSLRCFLISIAKRLSISSNLAV